MAATEKIGWKLVEGLSGFVAVFATKKVLDAAWKAALGKEPPATPEHPDTTWREAVGWALASGVGVGLVRLVVDRKIAAMWRARTGFLPPGLEDDEDEKEAEKAR